MSENKSLTIVEAGQLATRPSPMDALALMSESEFRQRLHYFKHFEKKMEWQRENRRRFVEEHGFSSASHYSTGQQRKKVLERDNYSCVDCGMTDAQHRAKWGRPITVDHMDKNRKHNTMDNLRTLCLRCHGSKDISPQLTVPRVPQHKETIIEFRKNGATYRAIGQQLGFTQGIIHRWIKRWEKEE